MPLIAALLLALSLGSAEPMDESRVRREGEGDRRQALNNAELKAFDLALFSHLTDWRNGSPLTAEDIQDKVVLIVVWDVDNGTSVRSIAPTLKRLELTHPDKGLLTLAVHTQNNWESAQPRLKSDAFATLMAHDAEGKFVAALQADGTPDTYIIDRAGQLRFADLDERDTPSVIRALLNETPAEAAGAAARRAANPAPAPATQPATAPAATTPEVARPESAAYAAAGWPRRSAPKDLEDAGALDHQGKPLPVALGSEKWLTKKPESLDGRVLVLDFWATWCGPCIRAVPTLEALAKQHPDDLAVIAISGQREGEAVVTNYLKNKKPAYHYIHDDRQSVYRSFASPRGMGIPHVVVISSDGVVRWQGNPLAPNFTAVVNQAVNADPWVVARRKSRG